MYMFVFDCRKNYKTNRKKICMCLCIYICVCTYGYGLMKGCIDSKHGWVVVSFLLYMFTPIAKTITLIHKTIKPN